MTDEHVLESIAAYVLGSFSEPEAAQVQQHLEVCDTCQEEVRACEAVLIDIAEGVPQYLPPKYLRDQLIQSLPTPPKPVPPPPRPSFWQTLFGWRIPALAGLGLVLLLVLSNLLLWQQVTALRKEVAKTEMIVEPLHPVEVAALATGLVIMDPHGEYGTIIVNSLVPSAEGQQYQVWLGRGSQVDSGGVFTIWENGYGAKVIYAPEPLYFYERVWVTVEPEGGSESPTGEAVLTSHP